jgi:hypothetical protein
MDTKGYPYLVIDDSNAHEFAADNPGGSTGYQGWHTPGTPHVFRGPRPVGSTIPRNEWVGRIQAGQGNFLSDLVKQQGFKSKDQNGLNYCWCYGSTRAVEVQRAVQGFAFTDLSPESVGGPCTGWRNTGGYAQQAFTQIEHYGICESSFMDKPHSLNPRVWKTGWQQNALLHEAVDWYDIGTSFDEVITCLLQRVPVAAGLDWWGHLVCFLDPVILPDGSVGVLFENSWGVDWPTAGANGFATLTEKKATPDGAAAPIITMATVSGGPNPAIAEA